MSTSKRGHYTNNTSENPSGLSMRFPRGDGAVKEALYATVTTPNEEESGEDDGYGDRRKHYWIDWYELDLKRGVINRSLPTMPLSARQDAAAAVVSRNKIFVLGGRCFSSGTICPEGMYGSHGHDYVFYFDYDRPDQGWKQGPPMLVQRDQPCVVALDTKIYVFGGIDGYRHNNSSAPHAEFLDTEENKWRPLPPPPPLLFAPTSNSNPTYNYISDPVLVDSPRRRILVHLVFDNNKKKSKKSSSSSCSSTCLYAFNVDDHSWHCLKDDLDDDKRFHSMRGFWWSRGTVALAGDVIYWVNETSDCHYDPFIGLSQDRDEYRCCLHAYDLAENKHLTVHWLPSFELRLHTGAQLYHLGGRDLCLADWGNEGFEYVKIRVFRDKDSDDKVYAHAKSDSLNSIPFETGTREFSVDLSFL